MSIFSTWQPRYAGAGIPTFPVRFEPRPSEGFEKIPMITNYMKVGLDYSRELAAKFPDAPGIGFVAGPRSGLAFADVDSTDPAIARAAFDRLGEPAIVVRTASGKLHGWYRNSGERKEIKPSWTDLPLDIIGDGGYIVAPGSETPDGGAYRFERGFVGDLHRLSTMSGVKALQGRRPAAKIEVGRRNENLFKLCWRQAQSCDTLDDLIGVAHTFAREAFMVPMSEAEITKTARSAWNFRFRYARPDDDGGSLIEATGFVRSGFATAHPDAYALLSKLRVEWGAAPTPFPLSARGFAQSIGWTEARLRKAIAVLVKEALIERVRRGGGREGDRAMFRWPALESHEIAPLLHLPSSLGSVVPVLGASDQPRKG